MCIIIKYVCSGLEVPLYSVFSNKCVFSPLESFQELCLSNRVNGVSVSGEIAPVSAQELAGDESF